MENIRYKCPVCNKAFKKESGRNWHLAHIHEINAAISVISQDYESKLIASSQNYESKLTVSNDEKVIWQQKAADSENRLIKKDIDLTNQIVQRIDAFGSTLKAEAAAEFAKNEFNKAILIIAVQAEALERGMAIPLDKQLKALGKILAPNDPKTTIEADKHNGENKS